MNSSLVYQVAYRIVWPFFSLVHPIRVVGRENIPEGGAVICPNHSALCDPVMACFAFTRHNQLHPMSKAEMRKVPVLGKLLEWGGVIFVNRGAADVHAIKSALHILKDGKKLLLFPEGTRIRNGVDKHGNPAVAHTGAAMLAARTGVPLVPMYIPEDKPWFRPTTVVIGKPFMPAYEGRRPTTDELDAITGQLMGQVAALKEAER